MPNLTTLIGITCLIFGFGWRVAAANGAARRLAASLRDPDPLVRASSARAATSLGLDRSAKALNGLIAREQHDSVLDAIASAVVLRQWEPADRAAVLTLRAWSAQRLLERGGAVRRFGPAVTRLADMGGPTREFAGTNGVTGDRTLDNTLAELRALCSRIGADRADFVVGEHLVSMRCATDAQTVNDVGGRISDFAGAEGVVGEYDIRIDHR